MIVTPLSVLPFPKFGDDDPNRPKGLHVSQIIGDMMKSLDPARYDKRDKVTGKPVPMDVHKVDYGLTFESQLEKMLIKTVFPTLFRPPAIQLDGIWMMPDGVVAGEPFGVESWVVAEYKLTWYSERKPCPEDKVFAPWLWQMKAYCKGMGTRFGLLIPQFVNGNYAPPSPSPPVPRFLEWSAIEIEENWSMLRNHAKAKGWLK